MNQLGVLYVALGAPYLAMALTSIASLRAFNPRMPVCLVTNVGKEPPSSPLWSNHKRSRWIFVDEDTLKNRNVKLDMYRLSPFSKTLYLDCDTLVLSDISQMSFFLDYFDVAARNSDLSGTDGKRILFDGAAKLAEIGHFNGGVIGFRKGDKTQRFFSLWADRYQALGLKRDQPALVEALYTSDVRVIPLPGKWNRGDCTFRSTSGRRETIIWHYKVRSSDRYIESYMCQALQACTDDSETLDMIKQRLTANRKARRYAKHPNWLIKSVINTLRGPMSLRPQRHVGSEKWHDLVIGNVP